MQWHVSLLPNWLWRQEVSCGMGEDLDQFSNMHISNTDPHVLYVTNGQGYQVMHLEWFECMEECWT